VRLTPSETDPERLFLKGGMTALSIAGIVRELKAGAVWRAKNDAESPA
jgi:hypothetical protein